MTWLAWKVAERGHRLRVPQPVHPVHRTCDFCASRVRSCSWSGPRGSKGAEWLPGLSIAEHKMWRSSPCASLDDLLIAFIEGNLWLLPLFRDHGNPRSQDLPWQLFSPPPPIPLWATCCTSVVVLVVQGKHESQQSSYTEIYDFLGYGDHCTSW